MCCYCLSLHSGAKPAANPTKLFARKTEGFNQKKKCFFFFKSIADNLIHRRIRERVNFLKFYQNIKFFNVNKKRVKIDDILIAGR